MFVLKKINQNKLKDFETLSNVENNLQNRPETITIKLMLLIDLSIDRY